MALYFSRLCKQRVLILLFDIHDSCCPGVSQIDRVVEAVEETLKGSVVHLLAKKKLPRLDLPKVPYSSPQHARAFTSYTH